jgi:hypothetical protein
MCSCPMPELIGFSSHGSLQTFKHLLSCSRHVSVLPMGRYKRGPTVDRLRKPLIERQQSTVSTHQNSFSNRQQSCITRQFKSYSKAITVHYSCLQEPSIPVSYHSPNNCRQNNPFVQNSPSPVSYSISNSRYKPLSKNRD